jgi:hypothetical protein
LKSPELRQFRQATANDVAFILELLREFYRKAGAIYGIPFDGPSTIQTIAQVIARGVCLVGPSSCAGATLAPFIFNHSKVLAETTFWCFRKPSEILIFEALMAQCKAAGATHIGVASLFPNNAIGRYYARLGFTFCEKRALSEL